MARPKGSKNKSSSSLPWPMALSTEERIDFLANIIIDTIIEDERQGSPVLKKIEAEQQDQTKVDVDFEKPRA